MSEQNALPHQEQKVSPEVIEKAEKEVSAIGRELTKIEEQVERVEETDQEKALEDQLLNL